MNKSMTEQYTIKQHIDTISYKYGFKYIILDDFNNIKVYFAPLKESFLISNASEHLLYEIFHLKN